MDLFFNYTSNLKFAVRNFSFFAKNISIVFCEKVCYTYCLSISKANEKFKLYCVYDLTLLFQKRSLLDCDNTISNFRSIIILIFRIKMLKCVSNVIFLIQPKEKEYHEAIFTYFC